MANALPAEEVSQTPPKPDDGLVKRRLGVGPLVIPSYSGSTSYQVWPVPLASLEFGDFAYIDYWQAGLYVLATKDRSVGLAIVAAPRIGYNSSDGDLLVGMMTRKSSLEMGLSVDYRSDEEGVSLAYLHDVTGASKGGVVGSLACDGSSSATA